MLRILSLLFLTTIALSFSAFGQKTPISAKIVLTQKAEGINSSTSVLSLTLQNNTDDDLYIPNYQYILLGDSSGTLFFIEKDGQIIQSITERNAQLIIWSNQRMQAGGQFDLANPISGMPSFYSDSASQVDLFLAKDSIIAQYAKHQKEPDLTKIRTQLDGFFFLKAHEQLHYALKAVENAKDLFKNRGSYTVFYRPILRRENEHQYPQQILTYKRFIPEHISCQPLYIEVK